MPKYNSLVAQESNFCRNSVALFDLTSFSKYSVAGPDALAVMQRLCCANMDVEPGSIVYTGMLNQRGGYEADVTATRLSEREFSVVSATAQATKDLSWIRGTFAQYACSRHLCQIAGPCWLLVCVFRSYRRI